MTNKLLALFLIFFICTKLLYSQDNIEFDMYRDNSELRIEEASSNAFLSYMQGRSKVGINFSANILMHSFGFIGDLIVKMDSVSSTLIDILPHSDEASVLTEFNIKTRGATWGLSINYDFTVLPFATLSFEVGFINASFSLEQIQYITYSNSSTDRGLTDYNFSYRVLPYSIGMKFFPWQQAPWGFYIMPKLGGTYVEIVGNVSASVDSDNTVIELPIVYTSGHGFYASAEIGWSFKLFPNMSKNWAVEIGIDIALFDIGYYFMPWSTGLINNLDGGGYLPDDISQYLWALNIRAILLPKLGFSIKF